MQNKIWENSIHVQYNDQIEQGIELSEDTLNSCIKEGDKSVPRSSGGKYRVNLNNIGRIEKSNNAEAKKNKISTPQMTQIIVISKKRKRDPTLDEYNFLESDSKSYKRMKTSIDEISASISNKFQNMILSDNKGENQVKEIEIKDRSNKIFSRNLDNCNMCSPAIDDNSNLFKNYYPENNSISNGYFKILKASDYQKSLKQFSEIRQLKFMEKRKLLSGKSEISPGNLLSNKSTSSSIVSSQLREIQNQYSKLYGECKIINDKEKLIIVNDKHMTKEEIQKSMIGNNADLSFFIMEVENEKCRNESQILEEVNNYEENKFIADVSSESEYNKELDYDSNREDNSNNEYPDEEDSEDEYENYNTYTKGNSTKYDKIIKSAEKRLNNAYIKHNKDLYYGYNPDSNSEIDDEDDNYY